MGCCGSNISKINRPDIVVEERIIESQEKLLIFSQRKLEGMLFLIEKIDFPLDIDHLQHLCQVFNIQASSPSGLFLVNLISKKLLTTHMLRNLSLLLSEADPASKMSLFFSHDKKVCIQNIETLLNTAIEIIPRNIDKIDSSVFNYTNNLKIVAENYVNELKKICIEEVKEQIEQSEVSSKDLRIKMYYDFKNFNLYENYPKVDFEFDGKARNTTEGTDEQEAEKAASRPAKLEIPRPLVANNLPVLTNEISLESSGFFKNSTIPEIKQNCSEVTHSLLDKIPDDIGDLNYSDDSLLRSMNEDSLVSPFIVTESKVKYDPSDITSNHDLKISGDEKGSDDQKISDADDLSQEEDKILEKAEDSKNARGNDRKESKIALPKPALSGIPVKESRILMKSLSLKYQKPVVEEEGKAGWKGTETGRRESKIGTIKEAAKLVSENSESKDNEDPGHRSTTSIKKESKIAMFKNKK